MNSPLQNTYKLLTQKNKLTIGYLGGSITLGGSCKIILRNGERIEGEEGTIANSYVNRTTAWFRQKFPKADIQTVNAGVSDTHSQLGLYRLEKTLMNNNGHDIPDLVFIEFTSNDWVYGEHSADIVQSEVESLVINIRKINPFADIVIVATNTMDVTNLPKKQVHKNIADHYGLPFIDVGIALQRLKNTDSESAPTERAETKTLKYSVDNLHPSALGYKVYLDEIVKVLEPLLTDNGGALINRAQNHPAVLSQELYTPKMLTANDMKIEGEFELSNSPMCVDLYGTNFDEKYNHPLTDNYIKLGQNATLTTKFNGSILGILLGMQRKIDVNLEFQIDSGEWHKFEINDEKMGFQRYPHTEAYFLKAGLSNESHTVTLKNANENPVHIGALLAQI
ncbi:MAG: SGNH/GDSL hydrolase family protein [Ruminococcaceae bacterium]|nr:SGNH/GDSL hydrolase family protein [Oscillospiraceae bacterium]